MAVPIKLQLLSTNSYILPFLLTFCQDADIDALYKSYSASTRQSLEAWSGSQLDLGIVCIEVYIKICVYIKFCMDQ